jgi:hypothetical protein
MRIYDEGSIISQLKRLNHFTRSVFSLSCAVRAYPPYQRFISSEGIDREDHVGEALQDAWKYLQNIDGNTEQLKAHVNRLDSEIEKNSVDGDDALADEALYSSVFALSAIINDSVQDAAMAARHGYDAVDSGVSSPLELSVLTAENLKEILANPVVQRELDRQIRDLTELLTSIGESRQTVIERFKSRAESEPALP